MGSATNFDKTFLSYIVEPLSTIKFVARKRRLYKYLSNTPLGKEKILGEVALFHAPPGLPSWLRFANNVNLSYYFSVLI